MPISFEPFLADLRQQCVAAWPETASIGIYDSEHANRVPWTKMTLPYGVIHIPEWMRVDGALDTLTYQPEVYVYYVAQTAGRADGLRQKLNVLVNRLWPDPPADGPLTAGQVMDVGDISVGDDLIPNQVFVAANRAQRAGMVTVTCRITA